MRLRGGCGPGEPAETREGLGQGALRSAGGGLQLRAALADPQAPGPNGLKDSVPGPGRSSLGGELSVGVEVLPRNFLGGLSRSPAAGSTTQRSSTSLGTRQLGQREERDPSPTLPRAGDSRIPGRPPRTRSTDSPHHRVIPFPGERQDLLEWRWGSPQKKHEDIRPPHLAPTEPGLSHCGCNSCHRTERAVGDEKGERGTKKDKLSKRNKEQGRERQSKLGREMERTTRVKETHRVRTEAERDWRQTHREAHEAPN